MKESKQWRFPLEVIAARLGISVLPRLPRGTVLLLATSMGRLGFIASARDRRVAFANLSLAFPERSNTWRRRVARACFETFALTLLDMAWFSQRTKERLAKWVTIDSSATAEVILPQIIGLTCHYGNWELITRAMANQGVSLAAVAAPLANRTLDHLFLRLRTDDRVSIIWKQGAIRGILKAIREKKSVAFVMDQNVLPEEGGIFAPFFGLPALFSTAPAGLLAKTGLRAVNIFCRREKRGRYLITACPPFTVKPDEDRRSITNNIAKTFEHEIATHPEQWLWMYKRWKYLPAENKGHNFPFYAKPLPGSQFAAMA